MKSAIVFLGVILCFLRPVSVHAQDRPETSWWYSVDERGNDIVHLHFFWAITCPHCKRAIPFLQTLESTYPWLQVHAFELTQQSEHVRLFVDMAAALGQEVRSVPAFLFCEDMIVGYGAAATTGAELRTKLLDCYQRLQEGRAQTPGLDESATETLATPALALPWIGDVDPSAMSLPIATLVIAGLDAFNPCAFFVLLFLLSLLIHAHSRLRMMAIGGIFVLGSGLMYFLFMAAWLNVFLFIGQLRVITLGAGAVALIMALINIKDYFWFKHGVSLMIPEQAKPNVYKRVRGLIHATSLPSMIAGTIVLAVMANTYELLCTAGFPMVYTRILTLHSLPTSAYYLYLMFYNLIYVIPLGVIVVIFTITLSAHKLQEEGGRRLKLLSGLMMLHLSLVLLVAPQWLDNVLTAMGILAATIIITGFVIVIERLRADRKSRAIRPCGSKRRDRPQAQGTGVMDDRGRKSDGYI